MIGDDVSVGAGRALDQDSALVVAVFGDDMGGPVAARFAGEGELIGGFLRARDLPSYI